MTIYADDSTTIARFTRKVGDLYEHLPLSNFYPSPIAAPRGLVAPTVEHYYQAAKTKDRDDQEEILAAGTPAEAKKLGQKVKLRPDWDYQRLHVMRRALVRKFDDHEEGLGLWLARTDPCVLVEGNSWGDTFWGATLNDDGDWVGENWLGTLLMARRSELVSALLETPAKSFDELLSDADDALGPVAAEVPVAVGSAPLPGCDVRLCEGPHKCSVEDEFAGAFDADDFYYTPDMKRCASIKAEKAEDADRAAAFDAEERLTA